MRSLGMALAKWSDGILMLWMVLSAFCYLPPAYLKTRYPLFFRHLDRFATYLWFVIAPIAAYRLFLSFRSAQPGARFVFAFLGFVILLGLVARWWNSQNKSAPSRS